MPSRGRCLRLGRAVAAYDPSPVFRIVWIRWEIGQRMSSLRAQYTSGTESVVTEGDDPRTAEAKAKVREAKPGSRVRGSLAFAAIVSMLWAGAASAFLWGYFQTLSALATLDLQFLSFATIVTFLPPLLFIA